MKVNFSPFTALFNIVGKVFTYIQQLVNAIFQKNVPRTPQTPSTPINERKVDPQPSNDVKTATLAEERLAAVKKESELFPPKDPAVSQATAAPVEKVPNETNVLQAAISPSNVAKLDTLKRPKGIDRRPPTRKTLDQRKESKVEQEKASEELAERDSLRQEKEEVKAPSDEPVKPKPTPVQRPGGFNPNEISGIKLRKTDQK